MEKRACIVSVITMDEKLLWHTRKGLSENKNEATQFKTVTHALKLCRKKYSRKLGHELKEWKASEI